MKYTDICLDIETCSTSPRTVIFSIGAVAFNRFNKEGDGCAEFEIFINMDDQVKNYGREIDQSTMAWWFVQSDGARKAIANGLKDSPPLKEAMQQLSKFVKDNCNGKQVTVWGNGANFDNPVLEDAFKQAGMKSPWMFWNDRCLRTILGEHKLMTGRDLKKETPFSGVKHSALSDAYHQANLLIIATDEIYRKGE